MYDIVLIGAGPANISCANYLKKNNINNFAIIDIGKNIELRDHNLGLDCVHGIGGAGLFSDGKFSFYPSGTYVWEKFNPEDLTSGYCELKNIFKGYIDLPELDFDSTNTNSNQLETNKSEWNLKNYKSSYLNLESRKNLINDLILDIKDKFILETQVISIEKTPDHYKIICANIKNPDSNQFTINSKNIVFGTGRFGPLFIKSNIPWIPLEFKRVELGVRVVGESTHPIFNISSNTDPKFIKQIDPETQTKTFCWCRSGETVLTQFVLTGNNQINTFSGRSDVIKTSQSNFGFNIVYKNPSQIELLEKAIKTKPFNVTFDNTDYTDYTDNTDNTDNSIPSEYKPIFKVIKEQIESIVLEYNTNTQGLNVIGPTIEGVGYYPITDDFLQVSDENIWVGGDCSGKFRGIIPSMLSGIYIASQIVSQSKLTKKVIFISGKRYVGKGETAKLLKSHYENQGKKVLLSSFSYLLKVNFCKEFGLDLERFIQDHKYKDTWRDELTEYFSKTNPMDYAYYLESIIDLGEYDVYVIDDLRLLEHVKYIKNVLSAKYQIQMIRICSDESERIKRGLVKTKYDESIYETELDNYIGFDKIIINNESIDNLSVKLF